MRSWKCDTIKILDFVVPIQNVLYKFFSALSLFHLGELEKFFGFLSTFGNWMGKIFSILLLCFQETFSSENLD